MPEKDGSEDRSEEFVRFVKENRDIIMRILSEDDESHDDDHEHVNDRSSKIETEYVAPVKDFVKDTTSTVLKVLSDEDVQKHFITGCMEIAMCFEAMVRAIPMSDDMRDVVNNAEKARDSAVKRAVASEAVATTKAKVEKISVTNVKKKVFDEVERVKDAVTGNGEDE